MMENKTTDSRKHVINKAKMVNDQKPEAGRAIEQLMMKLKRLSKLEKNEEDLTWRSKNRKIADSPFK